VNALKAQWAVYAGLIPSEPMPEYTKAWSYTSDDYAADGNKRGALFFKAASAADRYANDLRDGGLNWVTTSYIWM